MISNRERGSGTHDRQQGGRRIPQVRGSFHASSVFALEPPSCNERRRGRAGADPELALVPAERRRPLGWRARRGHDPRIGISSLLAFLGRESDPVCEPCARYILDHQLPEGGWSIYPGGPAEVSASVKAYFALKLVGYSPDDPALVRARKAILELGGANACNSFTRFYLALLGQIGYDECPSVPPELVLIPSRLNFSLERDVGLDAHDRGAAFDHVAFQAGPDDRAGARDRRVVPRRAGDAAPQLGGVFLLVELLPGGRSGSQVVDRWVPAAWRRPAIKAAHRWMLEHFENTDGLGAIFPPMIYTIVALHCLGYDPDSPAVHWAWRQLDDLRIDEGDRARMQPCLSPVWDTAIATIALSDAGSPTMSPRWPAPSTGCSPRRSAIPATGRRAGPASSPPAGTSSIATSFTPTSTTRPWW